MVARDSLSVAFEGLGETTNDAMLSGDQKKRLEEARRRSKQETDWAVNNAGRRNNYLPMAFGAKKFKRDKANSPCFECK